MSIRGFSNEGSYIPFLNPTNPHQMPLITEIPLGQVERLLACKDWFQILSSPEHFLATCYLQLMNQKDMIITRESDKLITNKHVYREIKESIKKLRILLLKGLESGSSELFLIKPACYICEQEDQIASIFEHEGAKKGTTRFNLYLSLELPNILKSLDLSFDEVQFTKQLPGSPLLIPVTKYTIHWQQSLGHTFLVPPVGLPREEPPGRLNSLLFERRNETGDFTFTTAATGSLNLSFLKE
ncbi:MAG: hypothetical protein KDK44_00430, partial [Chlamydiia bacterium]|nr:hypothetical protein [Chlamydiia bacterium]